MARAARFTLLPLYLRREPSTDWVLAKYAPGARRFDVVAYHDAEVTSVKARWMWDSASKPDRRFKRVTLNCFDWEARWLPDLPFGEAPSPHPVA